MVFYYEVLRYKCDNNKTIIDSQLIMNEKNKILINSTQANPIVIYAILLFLVENTPDFKNSFYKYQSVIEREKNCIDVVLFFAAET